jgi:arsenate reductase (glutaredoxin)
MATPVSKTDNASSAVRIYHNPRCSKSRQTLELIRSAGVEPEIIRYLETPPSRNDLEKLVGEIGITPAELIRKGEKTYKELDLAKADDVALLDAMAAHPILINRPIVATARGVRLCRPPETVMDILPAAASRKAAAQK